MSEERGDGPAYDWKAMLFSSLTLWCSTAGSSPSAAEIHIPLVEVVGGRLTSEDAVEKALVFYGSIGKRPIHIRREVKGYVANRLQAALWREAFYLVEQGIASVEDIDTAIAHGPGLRWALLGPFLNLHLSGGAGGIAHVLEHLGPPVESWWRDLGDVTLNEELNAAIARGVTEERAAPILLISPASGTMYCWPFCNSRPTQIDCPKRQGEVQCQ